ncbi:MAG: hypothetical protein ACRC0F_04395 [Cetobacterium sp.]
MEFILSVSIGAIIGCFVNNSMKKKRVIDSLFMRLKYTERRIEDLRLIREFISDSDKVKDVDKLLAELDLKKWGLMISLKNKGG